MAALFWAGVPALSDELPLTSATWTAGQENQLAAGIAAYNRQEYQQAKNLLLPLAEAGHPKAMNFIGLLHINTNVFPNDPVAECDWYERAANAGYPGAMYNMSICHTGYGRERSPGRERDWLRMAATHGHVASMIFMAGKDKPEGEEYLRWMRRAVAHGNRFAKVGLWLDGYKYETPQMTASDFLCVSWHILILEKNLDYCD